MRTNAPRFYKCCFVFGLRSGVLVLASIETLFWALVSFAALYSEVQYMSETDLYSFTDYVSERDWWYFFIFERSDYPRDTYSETLRSNLIN
jgi:hypothetical protein